jgi:hypothetical protein
VPITSGCLHGITPKCLDERLREPFVQSRAIRILAAIIMTIDSITLFMEVSSFFSKLFSI